MTDSILLFKANADAAAVRRETMDGREWLVVPVVAIREGVLNGSLVPADEIARSLPSWNGRPIALNHPQKNGTYISANSPDVVENTVLGYLYNVTFEDNAEKGEMWLDVGKAERLGGDALTALERFEAGELVDVSTAYWADEQERRGTFNGKSYDRVAYNILPDHLAILLDEPGACSIDDGCGAPRVNKQKEHDMERNRRQTRIISANQDLSFDDITALLRDGIADEVDGYVWVADVFPDDGFVVYELSTEDEGTVGLFRRDYTVTEGGEVTLGEAAEVFRRTTYVEASTPAEPETNRVKQVVIQVLNALGIKSEDGDKPKETTMEELIKSLVSNERCELSEEELRATPEPVLKALNAQLGTQQPTTNAEEVEETEPDEAPEPAGDDTPAWARTLIERVETLGDTVQSIQANARATENAERDEIVARLAANEALDLGKEELSDLPIIVLRKLDDGYRTRNYAGRGGSFASNAGSVDEAEAQKPMPELARANGNGGN